MQDTVSIGFSVNPEQYFTGQDGKAEKGFLSDMRISLSGSSANVATCLRNMGLASTLFVPVEVESSASGALMDITLQRSDLRVVRMRCLKNSPMSIFPHGLKIGGSDSYGSKGVILEEYLAEMQKEVSRVDGKWRIATGVDKSFIPLAHTLLGLESYTDGFKSLSVHHTLCADKKIRRELKALVSRADLFILNRSEFEMLGMDPQKIHNLGVSIMVVTNSSQGGMFSLKNEVAKDSAFFEVVESDSKIIYKVGAGDWFNGALLSFFIENGLCFKTVSVEEMIEACNFAAKVAAKKITMPGGANGPRKEDLG